MKNGNHKLKRMVLKGIFFFDGLNNFDAYSNAPLKVLFLLKEVNINHGEPEPIEKWWDEKYSDKFGLFATRLADWTLILWEELKNYVATGNPESERLKALRSIAIVNVKKIPGGSSSSKNEIVYHANKYADNIREEIAILNPDIVMLCANWYAVRDTIFKDIEWKVIFEGYEISISNSPSIIYFNHPAIRYSNAKLKEDLKRISGLVQATNKSFFNLPISND